MRRSEKRPTNTPGLIDWETVGQEPRTRGEAHEAGLTLDEMEQSLDDRLRTRDVLRLSMRLSVLMMFWWTVGQISVGLLTLIAWGVGFALSQDEATKEFYSAGAGAITTLLLGLALTAWWFQLDRFPSPRGWFQNRARGRDLRDHFNELNGLKNRALADALYREIKYYYFDEWTHLASQWVFRVFYGLCLLGSLLVGEMFALAALMDPHPEKAGDPRPVLAAVTAGLVGIGLVALLGSRVKRDP